MSVIAAPRSKVGRVVPNALWPVVALGDVLTAIETGKSFKCEERPPQNGETGVAKVSAVTWGTYDESESKTCQEAARINDRLLIRPDDFLFTRANTIELIGACVIAHSVTRRVMLSDKILRFVFSNEVSPKWVLYWLRSLRGREEIERLSTGNQESMRNIGQDRIRQIKIPLPPLPEQRRIVAEIEKQFTRLDTGVAALRRIQANLKRYRAAVLKAACEGRLVPTEADLAKQQSSKRGSIPQKNATHDFELGAILLERILTERRKLHEREQKNAARRKKYKEPTAPTIPTHEKLPDGWTWATWDQIGFSQNGRPFPSADYQETGFKLLRPGNLHVSGKVIWTENNTRCLPQRFADGNPDLVVGGGELVMNLTAQSLKDEFLGRVCVTGDGDQCLLNQRLARLTPIIVSSQFVFVLLKAWRFRRFVYGLNSGSLIQHMFTSQLAEFTFALPPLAEQTRIVAEVERRMSVVEETEAVVNINLQRATRLRRSILSQAFRMESQTPSHRAA